MLSGAPGSPDVTELQKQRMMATDGGQVAVPPGLGASAGPKGRGMRFGWNLHCQGPEAYLACI